jgi:hypothetical protein
MTHGEQPSSLDTTYLGPIIENFTYGTDLIFQLPGSEPPLVTWQVAVLGVGRVGTPTDGMWRTVELASATGPVYGPIQPDGSADQSTETILVYVVTTMAVHRRPRGPGARLGERHPRPSMLGISVEVVSAATGTKFADLFGPGLTRRPTD